MSKFTEKQLTNILLVFDDKTLFSYFILFYGYYIIHANDTKMLPTYLLSLIILK